MTWDATSIAAGLYVKYLSGRKVQKDVVEKLKNDGEAKVKNGQLSTDTDAVTINIADDNLTNAELAALGITKAKIDVVIDSSWADVNGTGSNGIITTAELTASLKGMYTWGAAHGIDVNTDEGKALVEAMYYANADAVHREDEGIPNARSSAKTHIEGQYEGWRQATAPAKDDTPANFLIFLKSEEVPDDSPIITSNPQNVDQLLFLALLSQYDTSSFSTELTALIRKQFNGLSPTSFTAQNRYAPFGDFFYDDSTLASWLNPQKPAASNSSGSSSAPSSAAPANASAATQASTSAPVTDMSINLTVDSNISTWKWTAEKVSEIILSKAGFISKGNPAYLKKVDNSGYYKLWVERGSIKAVSVDITKSNEVAIAAGISLNAMIEAVIGPDQNTAATNAKSKNLREWLSNLTAASTDKIYNSETSSPPVPPKAGNAGRSAVNIAVERKRVAQDILEYFETAPDNVVIVINKVQITQDTALEAIENAIGNDPKAVERAFIDNTVNVEADENINLDEAIAGNKGKKTAPGVSGKKVEKAGSAASAAAGAEKASSSGKTIPLGSGDYLKQAGTIKSAMKVGDSFIISFNGMKFYQITKGEKGELTLASPTGKALPASLADVVYQVVEALITGMTTRGTWANDFAKLIASKKSGELKSKNSVTIEFKP